MFECLLDHRLRVTTRHNGLSFVFVRPLSRPVRVVVSPVSWSHHWVWMLPAVLSRATGLASPQRRVGHAQPGGGSADGGHRSSCFHSTEGDCGLVASARRDVPVW